MSKEIGNKLKQERINKKLTVDDVANKLKIRKFYIESMEAGDFKELPGVTYIIGFIRSYTNLLGIDSEPFLTALKDEGVGQKSQPVGLASPRMESALPSQVVIVGSIIAIGVFYLIWSLASSDDDNTKNTTLASPSVVIEKVNIQDGQSQTPENIQIVDGAVAVLDTEKTSTEDTSISKVEISGANDTTTVKAEATADNTQVARTNDTKSELPYVNPEGTDYGSAEKETARIVVYATEETWLQLRGYDEELLFSKVILEGDRFFISNYTEDFVLDTGNAGGIVIAIDGKALPVLGESGDVVKGFELTEENLKNFAASAKTSESN